MSVFSSVSDSASIDSAGAGAPDFTRNAYTAASALTLGGFGVMSVALTATVAPAQTLLVCGAGGALAYAGKRKADGKNVLPSFGRKSEDNVVASVTAPSADAVAA